MPKIFFKKQVLLQDLPAGIDLTKAYELYPNLPLKFGCRNGQCGVCAIRVLEGADNLTRKGSQEMKTLVSKDLSDDYRLACQCAINGDITVEV